MSYLAIYCCIVHRNLAGSVHLPPKHFAFMFFDHERSKTLRYTFSAAIGVLLMLKRLKSVVDITAPW